MMAVRNEAARTQRRQQVAQAAWIGVGLQVACVALPFLDLWFFGSVERNVESAYPRWEAGDVAADRNAIVGYLVVVGVLGLAGWFGTLWAARRDRAMRAVVTTLFTVGVLTLGTNAGIGGEAYDRFVPLWLGITLLVVPLFPGLTAVVAAWRGRRPGE